MTDLFGYEAPRAPFHYINNQRPSVAEQKAILCKQLGELLRTHPHFLASAGIEETRAWVAQRARAQKVFNAARASVNELQTAINQMSSYK